MKNWSVLVTRDARLTQSGTVYVQAETRNEAEEKALDIPQEDIDWTDDDSFHAGEDGTYVAEECQVKEVSTEFNVRQAAIDFSLILHDWLTRTQMSVVIELNKVRKPGVCHSHDYCDANMAMHEAWERQGVDPLSTEITNETESCMSDAMCVAWGAAWDMAIEAEFDVTKLQEGTK